jgi:hypothetical protein
LPKIFDARQAAPTSVKGRPGAFSGLLQRSSGQKPAGYGMGKADLAVDAAAKSIQPTYPEKGLRS